MTPQTKRTTRCQDNDREQGSSHGEFMIANQKPWATSPRSAATHPIEPSITGVGRRRLEANSRLNVGVRRAHIAASSTRLDVRPRPQNRRSGTVRHGDRPLVGGLIEFGQPPGARSTWRVASAEHVRGTLTRPVSARGCATAHRPSDPPRQLAVAHDDRRRLRRTQGHSPWLASRRVRPAGRVSRRNTGGPSGATPELDLSNASQRSRGPRVARRRSGYD